MKPIFVQNEEKELKYFIWGGILIDILDRERIQK